MHYYKKKKEVTYDVPYYFSAFNVFECGRKLLDRLDVSYERLYIATPKEEYFTEMLHSLIERNRCHSTPMSNKNLQEAVIRVMEDEKNDANRNVHNVTTDNLFQAPITLNVQKKDANVTYER